MLETVVRSVQLASRENCLTCPSKDSGTSTHITELTTINSNSKSGPDWTLSKEEKGLVGKWHPKEAQIRGQKFLASFGKPLLLARILIRFLLKNYKLEPTIPKPTLANADAERLIVPLKFKPDGPFQTINVHSVTPPHLNPKDAKGKGNERLDRNYY